MLADAVRTDRRRLRPLIRSTAATIALRSTVRARRDLVEHRVAAANQLRAHLQVVFPGAAGLFAALDSAISLTFLERFTTQSQGRLAHAQTPGPWLGLGVYSGRIDPEILHARLLAAPRGTTDADADDPHRDHAGVRRGTALAEHPDRGPRSSIGEQLAVHPDATSSPRCPARERVRAARLLAEIGDARGRFPTADSLACLAGVAPSTRQSGKVKAVTHAPTSRASPEARSRATTRAWISSGARVASTTR